MLSIYGGSLFVERTADSSSLVRLKPSEYNDRELHIDEASHGL